MSIDQQLTQTKVCNGETMGTRFSAVFWSEQSLDVDAIGTEMQNAVDRVDAQMSTWKPDSDLMKLNAAPVDEWQPIPDEFFNVLQVSQAISDQSNGAFDVGIGDIIDAWGFGPSRDQPDAEAINRLANAPHSFSKPSFELDFEKRSARRTTDRKLDLCGIAKGYGVDQIAKILAAFHITNFLVSIDGELRASGRTENGQPWVIGVEEPSADERKLQHRFELHNLAVATSGNYRHFFQVGGQKLSHTIDPTTGQPVNNAISSVTVFAQSCAAADAWATAIWVSGKELGMLARKQGWIEAAIAM